MYGGATSARNYCSSNGYCALQQQQQAAGHVLVGIP